MPLGYRSRWTRGPGSPSKLSNRARDAPGTTDYLARNEEGNGYAEFAPSQAQDLERSDNYLKQELETRPAFIQYKDELRESMRVLDEAQAAVALDDRLLNAPHQYESLPARVWIDPESANSSSDLEEEYRLTRGAVDWLARNGALNANGGLDSKSDFYFLDGFIVAWDPEARYRGAGLWINNQDALVRNPDGEPVTSVLLPGDEEPLPVEGLVKYEIVTTEETAVEITPVFCLDLSRTSNDGIFFQSAAAAALASEELWAHESSTELFYFFPSRIVAQSADGRPREFNFFSQPGEDLSFKKHFELFERNGASTMKLTMYEAAVGVYTRHHPDQVRSGADWRDLGYLPASFDEERRNFYDVHELLGVEVESSVMLAQNARYAARAAEAIDDNVASSDTEPGQPQGGEDGIDTSKSYIVNVNNLSQDTLGLIDAAMHFGQSHQPLRGAISKLYEPRELTRETACALAHAKSTALGSARLGIVAPIVIDVINEATPGAGLLVDFDSVHRALQQPGVLYGDVDNPQTTDDKKRSDEDLVINLLTDEQKATHAALAAVPGVFDVPGASTDENNNFKLAQSDRLRRARAQVRDALQLRQKILLGLAGRNFEGPPEDDMEVDAEDAEGFDSDIAPFRDRLTIRRQNDSKYREDLPTTTRDQFEDHELQPAVSFLAKDLLLWESPSTPNAKTDLLRALAASRKAQLVAEELNKDYMSAFKQRQLESAPGAKVNEPFWTDEVTNKILPPWAMAQSRNTVPPANPGDAKVCVLYVNCLEQLGWQLVNQLATGLLPHKIKLRKTWSNGGMELRAELVCAPPGSGVPTTPRALGEYSASGSLWGCDVLACVVGPQVVLVDAGEDPDAAVTAAAAAIGATPSLRDGFKRVRVPGKGEDGERVMLAAPLADRFTLTVRMRARLEVSPEGASAPIVQFAVSGTRAELPYRFAEQRLAWEQLQAPKWSYGFENLAGCYSDWMLLNGRVDGAQPTDELRKMALGAAESQIDESVQFMRGALEASERARKVTETGVVRAAAVAGERFIAVGANVDQRFRGVAVLMPENRRVRPRSNSTPPRVDAMRQWGSLKTVEGARAQPMLRVQPSRESVRLLERLHSAPIDVSRARRAVDKARSRYRKPRATHNESLGPARQLLPALPLSSLARELVASSFGGPDEPAGFQSKPYILEATLVRRPPRDGAQRDALLRLLRHHHSEPWREQAGALQRAMILATSLHRRLKGAQETPTPMLQPHVVDAETAMAVHLGFVESFGDKTSYVLNAELSHALALALTGLKLWLRKDSATKAQLLRAVIGDDTELQDIMDTVRHYNHTWMLESQGEVLGVTEETAEAQGRHESQRGETDMHLARTIFRMVHSCVVETGGVERLQNRVSVDQRFVQASHAFEREARCSFPVWKVLTRIFGALAFKLHEVEV